MQIGLINNLRAGRSDRLVSRMLSVLSEYPEVVHVETDRAGALPEAIEELARQGVELVLVNGGDGSLQHALTVMLDQGVFERMPMIAPLRGGRTNMTAKDLGAQRDPVQGLRDVIDAARAGRLNERLVHRPVLRAAYDRGRRVEYGMFYGVGMITRAIELVHRSFPQGRSQGSLGAGLVTVGLAAKTVLRPRDGILTPDKLEIRLDGDSVEGGEFRIGIASTLRKLYWNLDPFWGQQRGGIRFTAIRSDAHRFGSAIPGVLWGRPPRKITTVDNGWTSRNVERVQMRLSCGFTVDGEIFPTREDEVVTLTADRRVPFVRA